MIEKRYEVPTKLVEGTKKAKPISEWSDKELELSKL